MVESHRRPAGGPCLACLHPAAPPSSRLAGAPGALGRAARVAAALALAACAACGQGGGGTVAGARAAGKGGAASASGGGAALPGACELLAPADVQAVTREVSGSLSSTLDDAMGKDPGLCSYALGSGVPPRVISLAVRRAPSAEQAASQHQIAESGLRSLSSGAPFAEVTGLGDGAFWVGGQIAQLHVRRGDTLLIFTVQLDQEPLRAARALAGKALARLARAPRPPGGQGAAAAPARGAAGNRP
jgi:hypothetical protein